jgi:DNA phosphorothioation-dependent restriction protein DptG
LEIAKAPKEISDSWLEILKAPIENFIKDANRQIRSTKQRLGSPDAKGLLLIFNQGNLLHNRPQDFRLLMVSVLRKRKPNRELKFPHIHGLVYFSYETVKTAKESMSFWAPVQLQTEPGEDVTPMQDFQKDLQQEWYAFVQNHSGRTVRQHSGG